MTGNDRADPLERNDAAVQARLGEIQRRRGGRIRWGITTHTAELTIRAIGAEASGERGAYRPSGKSRRRKRAKRML